MKSFLYNSRSYLLHLGIVIPQEAADIGVEPGVPIDAFVDITDDESESRWYGSTVETLSQTSNLRKYL